LAWINRRPPATVPSLNTSRGDQSTDLAIPDRCHIIRIFYMGVEGGITCRLDIGGPDTSAPYIVSITHLIFARRIALFRQIDAYQRHRIKKIKLQNSRNY
jgi:hypothetical protein